MRIGIDGLHLFGKYSGVQRSLANLVEALRSAYPADEVILFVPSDFREPPSSENDPGLRLQKTWFPGRWRTIRTLWRDFRLQSRAYATRCDIIHGPTYVLPRLLSKPSVVTIHDCIALTHPQFCTPGSARIQSRAIAYSAQRARRIIVPSLATQKELSRLVECPESKIDVVPWGVRPEFAPLKDGRAKARAALKLPENYVLFVGNLEPKKNLRLLIEAFFAAKMHRKLPHKLVLAGQQGWGIDWKRLIRDLNVQDFVLFADFVPQAALPALYSLADLFVMPSIVEGFGLPVLEAMACGCPVLGSAIPALREVCGEAARLIPLDVAKPLPEFRAALEEMLTDAQASRTVWGARGMARAKLFTWEQTARLTRQSYEKALE